MRDSHQERVRYVRKYFQGSMFSRMEGFTLVELIMVVIITGILMAIALPRLGVINKVDLYSVASQVKSEIRYTQEMAMSNYKKATITFTSDSNMYTITGETPKYLPKRSKAIFDSAKTLTFTFNSYGEPIPAPITGTVGGTLRISSEGSYKEIKVERITGRATIIQ